MPGPIMSKRTTATISISKPPMPPGLQKLIIKSEGKIPGQKVGGAMGMTPAEKRRERGGLAASRAQHEKERKRVGEEDEFNLDYFIDAEVGSTSPRPLQRPREASGPAALTPWNTHARWRWI